MLSRLAAALLGRSAHAIRGRHSPRPGPPQEADKALLFIPVAKRELLGVTGISKQGSAADVDFLWKWAPINEVGAALYSTDVHYLSSVGFRDYDDGWRVVIAPSAARPGQPLDDALKNAESAQ